MLLSIGALPQNGEAPPAPHGAEDVAKPQEEAPLGADVAVEAVESERQEDTGEAPPGAEDDMTEDERMAEEDKENEDEEEDPDMTDEELDEQDRLEDEDEELDEDEPEEDEPEEDEPEDKEEDVPEELAALLKDEEKTEASDKLEEPVAPVSEIKAEV